jgi:hypothetical protein
VARLEARGVLLEPAPPGRLLVDSPADVTAGETEALRCRGLEVYRFLRARPRVGAGFPWPAALEGLPRTTGPLTRCYQCSRVRPLRGAYTWVRYGGLALCLLHALEAESLEVSPS